ncbi:Hint domain-containing protein [Algirhabdus cladophorae]|uniref:Hint domain-containing protein n=1 Tax=Algirhabdus cladophorae TaxID=3377108 RepID=UPI003B8450F4
MPKLVGDAASKTYYRRPRVTLKPLVDQTFDPDNWDGLSAYSAPDQVLSTRGAAHIGGFALGSSLLTRNGKIPIQNVRAGDEVFTLDHGLQAVERVLVTYSEASADRTPVKIRKGALRNSVDLWVCPDQLMMINDWNAELLFGDSEVLVPARYLVDNAKITEDFNAPCVTYFHILFASHHLVMVDGIASGSVNPFAQYSNELRTAHGGLVEHFPELRFRKNRFGPAARKVLHRHEAKVLMTQIKGL